jgi:hypothetical protein
MPDRLAELLRADDIGKMPAKREVGGQRSGKKRTKVRFSASDYRNTSAMDKGNRLPAVRKSFHHG